MLNQVQRNEKSGVLSFKVPYLGSMAPDQDGLMHTYIQLIVETGGRNPHSCNHFRTGGGKW